MALGLGLWLASGQAGAHALWKLDGTVPPRNTDLFSNLKTGPCGGLPRGTNPAVFRPGQTITVQWVESINHKGYFQIFFSPANDTGFVQLGADIPDTQDGPLAPGQVHEYSASITLPNVTCTDCTLQLIQVMLDNPGNPSFYYSCADIRLAAGNPADTTPPADVAGFTVTAGDTQAYLAWTNPAADFYRVLVLRDTAPVTAVPQTGIEYQPGDAVGSATVAYVGNGQSATVTGLTNGTTYYFKAFAYDLAVNYASGVTGSAALPNPPVNVAPVVNLLVKQAGTDTLTVNPAAGMVEIQALVSDGNPGDSHAYDWTGTDPALVDTDAVPATLSFDPAGLAPGMYAVSVTVTDDGMPAQSAGAGVMVTVTSGTAPAGGGGATAGAAGGGCTVSRSGAPDALLVLLLIVASVRRPVRRLIARD